MKEILLGNSTITSNNSSSQTVIPKMVVEFLGEPVKGKKIDWFVRDEEEIVIRLKKEE